MEWITIVITVVVLAGAAWVWGSLHDPKHGGTIGCCGCGQCFVTGECVMVKKKQENAGKKPPVT
ncbi:MAG: hypothetical protein IKU81_07260 [Oscillibacter sp.]|nr:hypothetical protein [Oscillibacter sp.]